MKPETIKELIDRGYSSRELEVILREDNNLRIERQAIEWALREIERVSNEKIKRCSEEMKDVKSRCPHYEVTSETTCGETYYLCELCGETLKEDPNKGRVVFKNCKLL